MRSPTFIIILFVIMILLDTYVFQAIKVVSHSASPRTKTIVYSLYWGISILALLIFLFFVLTDPATVPKKVRTYLFATVVGLFFGKLISVIFFLVDDLRRVIQWVSGKLFFRDTEGEQLADDGISRSAFLSWMGLAAGGTLFGSLVYGFSNKYNYDVRKLKLSFDNLPASFRGLKIVHISDIHAGSFTNKQAVIKGIDKIMAAQPDIILFSGDIVNDRATEMDDYMDVFNRLKAPLGIYSTFGNHDYGDYASWPFNGISKQQNLQNLAKAHADLGWRLLMNEHVVLEKNGEQIALLGIENWSNKARFPKHGRLDRAYAGTEKYPFKILISHDPSHWEGQVRPHYPDVDLMVSGHTHGMQFGVEIPGFRWSPVQYVYKEWAGLYEEGKQKLYVNRGFGFIGYPGRVGILPEITVIELI